MMKKVVHLFFIVLGVVLGYQLCPDLFIHVFHLHHSLLTSNWFGAAIGGALLLVATISLAGYVSALLRWLEERLKSAPLADILGGTIGMVIGLVVAYLFSPEIRSIPVVGVAVQFFVAVFFAYLGLRIGFTKREELFNLFSGRLSLKERGEAREKKGALRPGDAKLLDTSVIIDGRIADLVDTGFVDGTLIIASFVLEELQHIADSSDVLKRNRGRRGLDVLNRIQKESKATVQIVEIDFDDIQEVDSKLVRLAKQMHGKVMTNDFNLNKVCELQGVPVLNINDLANALKPVVLPGEELHVQVIKDGKEYNQGVAYLDDGTMIVIEGGREYIGGRVTVLVTSVLQTSAGRMIFAKPKLLEKAL
ncbi:PilT protein domain-containing protein [Alicyclobacillus hesperidum URH17-3-68]|uniref:PIN and TRAM-domain containing protein YacL n=1 Tax=Alicyclobacillus hesperidum TaxID=89784 RepID=A0AA37U987_9BACL|nr:PIN/TRAM domain-containing protein [Alicyclobacillus hesperidum]EJY56830.1 PilT protein domain-containing protein [Alicyclobacillus hesperidum URH17-3-68]GLV12898.1 putative PIN and TRAM-domain containing protein YacL [Alicyclobacillus hesperidum]